MSRTKRRFDRLAREMSALLADCARKNSKARRLVSIVWRRR